PVMHPKLTMALGRALGDDGGHSLLTEENLALLCRLPWIRRGRMPDWLRLGLVRDLERRPGEAERVRATWSTLLEPQETGDDAILPIEVGRQAQPGLPILVAGLLRRSGPYREAILLAFLNRKELPELAMELPDRLSRLVRGDDGRRMDCALLG